MPSVVFRWDQLLVSSVDSIATKPVCLGNHLCLLSLFKTCKYSLLDILHASFAPHPLSPVRNIEYRVFMISVLGSTAQTFMVQVPKPCTEFTCLLRLIRYTGYIYLPLVCRCLSLYRPYPKPPSNPGTKAGATYNM